MGPMFSALIIVPALLVLLVLAFIVARLFQPTSVALRLGLLFVVGAFVGVGLSVATFSFLFGSGTLATTQQVVGFLSALAGGGLFGGAFALWSAIKLRVLTLRSSGTVRLRRPAP